ncbi:MAG TPA: hypothetical protein VM802_24525 [Chitinophaga sp.]|uniref:hypothetical protein n=1 Tax=Chitinophaga sp. TaxID=1869181 RepID=UPI002BA45E4F|nr:hypothetical protein [Chitinophaga sp.]HVI48056.1 hypothetical protein [Chitinophaga sp.]
MELLLDAPEKDKPVAAWWWLLLALLLCIGGWWLMSDNNNEAKMSLKESRSKKTKPVNTNASDNSNYNKIITTTGITSSIKRIQKQTITAGSFATVKRIDATNPLSRRNTAVKVNADKSEYSNLDSYNISVSPRKQTINTITTKLITNNNEHTKINSIPEIPIKTTFAAIDTITKRKPRQPFNKWFAGLTLGPDFNVAPAMKLGNVGLNAGILLQYYFSRKWFASAGAVYSRKIYGATPGDYNAWTPPNNYYSLVKVNADCSVLDIPVNMNFTFLERKKSTLSATLGLSNYFMLKEKYKYIYNYGPSKEITLNNDNQHYLAILNAGALYQYPAGKHLILGVQPYVKIPLHGVGYGQVKLYSAGVSVQLMFTGKKQLSTKE